jgi:hypothetical protein
MGEGWTRGRIGFALIVAGCGREPEAAPPVRVDLSDGFVACGGQEPYVEAFALDVFEFLEQPVPEDLDLTLHILGRDEFEQLGVCPAEAGGCALEGEAWSTGGGGVDLHELTHVILLELAPQAIAGLGEGIAESLGTSSPWLPASAPRPPLAIYATKSTYDLSTQERVGAALYTTFLLDEFGPQAYLDLYRSLPRGSSVEEVDDRMREQLGSSLADLDARFADPAEARCVTALAFCGDLYGPVLEPPFEIELSLACEDPDVLGYTAEDGSRHPFRRWQILFPKDGPYWVEAEGAVFSGIRCGSCDERGTQYFNGSALMEGQALQVMAGLYVFEVNELLEGHETFRLAIHAAD